MALLGVEELLARREPLSAALTARYDPSPLDINPLPNVQRHGLIAVGVVALLSVLSTTCVLGFITYRLFYWRKYSPTYLGYNQNVVLIYNLLLADLIQAVGFSLALFWQVRNNISANTPTCFFQGLFLQAGDPGSGLFVLAIALNTFYMVTFGRKIEHRYFVCLVICVWVFLAVLVTIPIASHGTEVFIPSGAWCWINSNYEADRLWTHYIWIFFAEFGTIVLYAILFFQLRRDLKSAAALGHGRTEGLKRIRRVVAYMVIYPFAYLILSLPLAVGRMVSAAGHEPSLAYFCTAGAVITSSGLVDSIMYSLTRRILLTELEPTSDRRSPAYPSRTGGLNITHNSNLRTTVSAGPFRGSTLMSSRDKDGLYYSSRGGSMEQIMSRRDVELSQMGKVYQETTIEVTHSSATYLDEDSDRGSERV